MVIMEKPGTNDAPPIELMNRADTQKNPSMLTLGSFALTCITIFGCVLWACSKDSDRT
jgi:hypothetical protein